MAGSTFYGTTLTDLQGGRTAQDRMDAERQQLGTRLFAQAATATADRMAAKERADQEQAYRMFGLAQQDQQAAADRALRAQQLTMQGQAEIERQKAEQARTAAILESERIRNKGIEIQYPQGRLDPKMLEQIQKQNDIAAQTNTIADAAAREANFLLGQTLKTAQQEADKAAPDPGFFSPFRTATDVGQVRANKYRDLIGQGVDAIRLKLGDKAQYLNFNGKSFEPLKLPIHELPTRQAFPGVITGQVTSNGVSITDTDLAPRVGLIQDTVTLDPDPEANAFPGVNRVFPPAAPAAPSNRFIWSPNTGLRPLR